MILSQAVGKPVRVQWMRHDDFQWSTQSSAAYSDVKIGLDDQRQFNRISNRPLHACDAGRSSGGCDFGRSAHHTRARMRKAHCSASRTVCRIPGFTTARRPCWSAAYGTFQIGQKTSPINVGLRDHSLRTPGQYQQNFPRELAITEAAVLAGVDPLQFRIQHAREKRVIGVLESVREASEWETRSKRAHG